MKSAVILAAGQGLRLRPLTDKIPKCLAAVHGKSIMSYQLAALERAGIQRCVMVVGYMAGLVRDKFGSQYNAMELSYVENKCYAETNNLYSLWLAREQIADDILLLECDIIFEDSVLSELIESPILETACCGRISATYGRHRDSGEKRCG